MALRALALLAATPSCFRPSAQLRSHSCRAVSAALKRGSRRSSSLAGGSHSAAARAALAQTAQAAAQTTAAAMQAAGGAAAMEARIPGFLRWVDACNNGAAAEAAGQFVPLSAVGGKAVGYLGASFMQRLLQFPATFQPSAGGGLELHPQLATQAQRTAAVAAVLGTLREEGLISGWRDELYPAVQAFHDEPAFLIERAAAPHFGIKAYGVHINGYVRLPDGSLELWVARRSKSKPTWPGKLDHIVAGGQPHGLSCWENVLKECAEEASVPKTLAERAVAVGAVSYTSLQVAGLKRDVLFCYDLELPLDFVPQPQDGEVEEFMRLPIERVAELISTTDEFKDNCNLVILDFMLRHSYLSPDMRGYLQLLRGLRCGDCS